MLHIDKSKHQIWYYNRPLTLSTKEYQALLLLAEHGEQVTTREALMQHVWKTQHKSDSVVTQLLSQLKTKLNEIAAEHGSLQSQIEIIKTIRAQGYQLTAEVSFTAPSVQRLRPKLGYLLVASLSVMVILLSYYLSTTSPQSTKNAQQLTINETIKVDALHGVVPKLSPSGKYIVRKTVEGTVDYLEIVERDGRNLVIKFKDSGRGSLYWWANHSDMLLFYENRSFDSVTPQCYAHIYSVDSGEKQSLGDCTDVIYRTGVAYSTKLNATFSNDDSRVYISDNIGSNINPKRIRQYDVTEQRYLDNIELTLPADHSMVGILPTGAAPSTLIAILKSTTSGNSADVHAYRVSLIDGTMEMFATIPYSTLVDETITSVHQHLIYRDQSGGVTAVNIYTGQSQQLLTARSRLISGIENVGFDTLLVTIGAGFRMTFENVAPEPTIQVPTKLSSDVIWSFKIRNNEVYYSAKDAFGISQIFREQQGKAQAVTEFSKANKIFDFDVNEQGNVLVWNNRGTTFDGQLLEGNYRAPAFYDTNGIVFVDHQTNQGQSNDLWHVKHRNLKTAEVKTLFTVDYAPVSIQRDGDYLYYLVGREKNLYRWSPQQGVEILPLASEIFIEENTISVNHGKVLFKDIGRNLHLYDVASNQLQHIATERTMMTTHTVAYDGNNIVHLNVDLVPYTGYHLTLSSESPK